jgi:two-component sensor histidine kinase
VLTEQNWTHGELRQIIESAVDPFRHAGDDRIAVAGVPIALRPKAAVTIAMAFHELATNAVKYGALSNDRGRVEIGWRVGGEGEEKTLSLVWRELGGPPVRMPEKRGFGSRMIERGLAAELGGSVRLQFGDGGLSCHIEAPLSELASGSSIPVFSPL